MISVSKYELKQSIEQELKRRENKAFLNKLERFEERTGSLSSFFKQMCEDGNDEGLKEAIISALLKEVTKLTEKDR